MASLHDIVTKGSTNRSVTVRIFDSTDGTPETGVVWDTLGIDLWYRREGAAKTSITEATLAALTTAHTDGGFLHIGDGEYRLDLPDAAFATGAQHVDFGGTVTGMVVIGGRVRLVDCDLEDASGLGLSNLDATVSSRLAPTTAGRTLDVTTGGAAGIDWANVENPATAVDLSGTDIQLCDTITTYTGNTVQTGDTFARIGAAGAGLTGIPWNASWDAEVQSEVADALAAYNAVATTDLPTNFGDLSITATTGRVDVGSFIGTDTAGVDINGYLVVAVAKAGGGASPPNIAAPSDMGISQAEVSGAVWTTPLPGGFGAGTAGKIVGDNAGVATQIGTAGAGLTDLGGMSTAMKAEVLAEVNAAIDTAISELGVGAPTATPTLRTGLMLMYMALRNKLVVQTSGTDALEIYNDAGTKIASKTLTDDGSDYTEDEMA